MRKKVLWIEDGALFEAQHLAGPVYNSRKYDLDIALTISDAERKLLNDEFDIVIVDIRMNPGDMPKWVEPYQNAGRDKLHARLGLKLLYALFKPDKKNNLLEVVPEWIKKKERYGILTVETYKELEVFLKELSLESIPFRQKSAKLESTELLEIIEEVAKKI